MSLPLPGHGRSVCVRTCDGYLFPLANYSDSADLPAHQAACAAACPGTETALFTVRSGQELEEAVSLTGTPYRRLGQAFAYRTGRPASCACQRGGAVAARLPIPEQDPTLRAGDAIALPDTARVFTGRAGRTFVTLREARMLPASARRDLDRVLDISRRERVQATFHRDLLRARQEARTGTVRLRLASTAEGFAELAAGGGFAPVRVVMPSPFRQRPD